jgi:hypothetical protein
MLWTEEKTPRNLHNSMDIGQQRVQREPVYPSVSTPKPTTIFTEFQYKEISTNICLTRTIFS